MNKYEIAFRHPGDGRTQFYVYRDCNTVHEAIAKHEEKGFSRTEIIGIILYQKHKYGQNELTRLIGG